MPTISQHARRRLTALSLCGFLAGAITATAADLPGDTCATAIPLAGPLPIAVSGTTVGYTNDYDEACPFTDSTAPDVVYAFTPAENMAVSLSLCAGPTDFDTKLYVYEGQCPMPGGALACDDDACRSAIGQDFVSALPHVELTGGVTYYIVVDGYGTAAGAYELEIRTAPDCAADTPTLFSQPPEMDDWAAHLSDLTQDTGVNWAVARYENFDGLGGQITGLRVWGLNLFYDRYAAEWFDCNEDPMTFEVAFYNDYEGWPAGPACQYAVSAVGELAGYVGYDQFPVYEYTLTLPQPCALSTGWVSVVGAGDPNCWFLWLSSSIGDGNSIVYGDTHEPWDLSLCLLSDSAPAFGACCDDVSGTCQENVALADCTGRFLVGGTCAQFDPPCGAVLGACCHSDGTCTLTTLADCGIAPGRGDLNCDGVVNSADINPFVLRLIDPAQYALQYPDCPGTNADLNGDGSVNFADINPFVTLLLGYRDGVWRGPESTCDDCPACVVACPSGALHEPDGCGEDTNSGCDMPPGSEAFEPLAAGQTLCGTLWATEEFTDSDWFEIVLTEPAKLTLTVHAASPVTVEFLSQDVPGVGGCANLTGATTGALELDACENRSTTLACVPAGTYYALVRDRPPFVPHTCSVDNSYTITLSTSPCADLIGACCRVDELCFESTEGQCQSRGGLFQGVGTTCATVTCPPRELGDDCDVPIAITLPADLPYSDSNTTDGRYHPYNSTCLGNYDNGNDIVYELTVTQFTFVSIMLDPHSTRYTAWALDDTCPPDADCLLTSSGSATPHGVACAALPPGVYSLVISSYETSIPTFDLTITSCTLPLGRCCYGDPPQCAELSEFECGELAGDWRGDLDCNVPCLPPGDTCDDPFVVSSLPLSTQLDTSYFHADGPRAACDKYGFTGLMQNDAWFVWTPISDCVATATITAGYDAVLVVRSGCSAGDELFCADLTYTGTETLSVPATAGQTLYFQIGQVGTHGTGGLTDFTLDCATNLGACCLPDGQCVVLPSADCLAAGGSYLGDQTTCDPDPCPSTPGDNCDNPIVVTLEAANLPYVDVNSTVGRGNDYEDTCLGSYDSGQDIVYQLVVPTSIAVYITLDPRGSDYTGMLLTDTCPPGPECIDVARNASTSEYSLGYHILPPGTYTLMIDRWLLPDDIPEFELTIRTDDRLGACCDGTTCLGDVRVGECIDLGGRWYPDKTCATYNCVPTPGDSCDATPLPTINVSTTSDTYQYADGTTCGHGNAYAGDTCLGAYDAGQDFVYQLVVNGNAVTLDVSLSLSADSDESWLRGVLIADTCPPGANCLATGLISTVGWQIRDLVLAPGTYYLVVDSQPMRCGSSGWSWCDCGEFELRFVSRAVAP